MAVPSQILTNNAMVGVPQVAGEVNIYESHKIAKFTPGYKVERADGSVFRYSHFGADTNRGVLVAQDLSESSTTDTDNVVVASASSQTTSDGTAGSRFVEITLASVTANEYAGGYFITTDDTGEGYTYRIRGNTATDNPASGNFRLELEEPLQAALGTTTDFVIVGNMYTNLETATAATDAIPVGIACSTMDVSEAAYGWICTKSPAWGVLQDALVPAVGDMVSLSDSVSGAIMKLGGSCLSITDLQAEAMIGTCVVDGDSTGHSVIKFNLE